MSDKQTYYQIIAVLPGSTTKSIINKTELQVMDYVISFLNNGTIKEGWGEKDFSYQAYELKIYQTKTKYAKTAGVKLEDFVKRERNKFSSFEKRASNLLHRKEYRSFVIMPIQGKNMEARMSKEYIMNLINVL